MTEAIFPRRPLLDALDQAPTPPAPPKANWPLMGDILAHRNGIPEHLIQWRRAMGAEDPVLHPAKNTRTKK